jgi:hypothetical protein
MYLQDVERKSGLMAMSLGIWAERTFPDGALYRWEGDQGESGRGFVMFDAAAQTIRPAAADGGASGTLLVNGATGEVTGASDGLDRATFMQVAAAILKAYAKTGEAPATAHAYFG